MDERESINNAGSSTKSSNSLNFTDFVVLLIMLSQCSRDVMGVFNFNLFECG